MIDDAAGCVRLGGTTEEMQKNTCYYMDRKDCSIRAEPSQGCNYITEFGRPLLCLQQQDESSRRRRFLVRSCAVDIGARVAPRDLVPYARRVTNGRRRYIRLDKLIDLLRRRCLSTVLHPSSLILVAQVSERSLWYLGYILARQHGR